MKFTKLLSDLVEQNKGMVERAIDGLGDDELNRRPDDQSNSIAWLMWHTARVADGITSRVQGSNQLWVTDGWHEKFGMEPDPTINGVGHTGEQVAAFKASAADVRGYWTAALTLCKEYIDSIESEEQLDKEYARPSGDSMTAGAWLRLMTHEILVHGGQVAYLRGMHTGMGWFV